MVRPFCMFSLRFRSLALLGAGLAALLVCAACTACGQVLGTPSAASAGSDARRLVVSTWNLQALFDGTDDGTEYDDYRNSAGWSPERYAARLESLAVALRSLSEEGPDIIALQEVENAQVLTRFAAGTLAPWGYGWSAFGALPGAPLGVGLLSRYPVVAVRSHGITRFGETAPRPILEVRIDAGGEELVFFVCHWKSKLGGADATEGLRRAAAQIVARRMAELAESEPGTPVLVLGDLNENHDEYERRGAALITALMPDTAADRPDSGEEPYLGVSGSRPPAGSSAGNAPALYSPWTSGLWTGSYAYRGDWETIDHLLFSPAFFDGRGWEYSAFSVAEGEPFLSDSGVPNVYNPRTGNGVSDHLPLTAVIER